MKFNEKERQLIQWSLIKLLNQKKSEYDELKDYGIDLFDLINDIEVIKQLIERFY